MSSIEKPEIISKDNQNLGGKPPSENPMTSMENPSGKTQSIFFYLFSKHM
jgi:hypothetical protein